MQRGDVGRTTAAARFLLLNLLLACVPVAADSTPFGTRYTDVRALDAPAADRVESFGSSSLQRGELWLPDAPPRALVVLVHGGCWLNQFGVDHVRALADAIRDAGYAVLAPEYRRVGDPGGGWPGSLQDNLDALTHVLARRASIGIDADRYVIVGHSAGGHLALLMGHYLRDAGVTPAPSGVIGLAAITDPVRYARGGGSCNAATDRFFGGATAAAPDAATRANPRWIRARTPELSPTILLHGDADPIVPLHQAQAFVDAGSETDSDVRLIVLEGAGHFDLIHPHTQAFPALLEAIEQLLAIAEPAPE